MSEEDTEIKIDFPAGGKNKDFPMLQGAHSPGICRGRQQVPETLCTKTLLTNIEIGVNFDGRDFEAHGFEQQPS